MQTLIDKRHGMIVVTVPTGSGMNTTMFALLAKPKTVSRHIVTVENSVEYRLSGVNQVASDIEHRLGFAYALEYIMWQDPDVIMVGKICDHEPAARAVPIALTGHLRISTPHTDDAIVSVARLYDLGIDRFKKGNPTWPVDGTAYTIDTTTELDTGHTHRVYGSLDEIHHMSRAKESLT